MSNILIWYTLFYLFFCGLSSPVENNEQKTKPLKAPLVLNLNSSFFREEYNPLFNNEKDLDPIETSGQFEGDILLPEVEKRNAVRNEDLKWPGGVVPYKLPFFYGVRGRIMVALAASEFARNTCVRLVTRTNETDYVSIFRGNGCYSMVGRMGGEQKLSLATGCDQMGIVIHEFMHALGFWHEQSRMDRDDYVTIRWENISPGTENNFQKYTSYVQQTLDEQYDYASLLHYSRRAFSRNSQPTVEPKNFVGNFIIGQRLGFSPTDIRKINKLYNCTKYL